MHLFQPNSFVFSYVGKFLWGLLRFSKTCEFWSSKANWRLRFLLPSIILTDLLGNKLNFNRFKRSWFLICDWRISIRFVCFCVSRFVTCDRNYDWWQPKTQLWTRLLNFGVRMFVKSAVIRKGCIEVQEKKNKVVVLCWRFGKKSELRPHFHFAVLQWRQRNVQKSVIKCKVVFFFQSNATSIALFPFSFLLLPSSWSLLKPPIVYKRVCFVKEVNKTNTFLFTSFTIPRKLDS